MTQAQTATLIVKAQETLQDLLAKVAGGMEVNEAYDAIFGQGAYEKLAGEIWEELQAKGA